MRKAALAIGIAVVALLAWEVAASAALCFSYATISQFRLPYMQWVETAWWLAHARSPYDPTTGWYLTFSGGVASPILINAALLWRRCRRAKAPSLYGKAAWANPAEMDRNGIKLTKDPF